MKKRNQDVKKVEREKKKNGGHKREVKINENKRKINKEK